MSADAPKAAQALPYTEASLQSWREIWATKRALVEAKRYAEGECYIEFCERMFATIDNLAARLRIVEAQSAAHLAAGVELAEKARKQAYTSVLVAYRNVRLGMKVDSPADRALASAMELIEQVASGAVTFSPADLDETNEVQR